MRRSGSPLSHLLLLAELVLVVEQLEAVEDVLHRDQRVGIELHTQGHGYASCSSFKGRFAVAETESALLSRTLALLTSSSAMARV